MAAARLLLKQTNGVLIYNEKYPIPEVPKNYVRSTESPYMLKPILMECSFREYKETYIAKCGCRHTKMYCNHFKSNVTKLKCMECPFSDGQTVAVGKNC